MNTKYVVLVLAAWWAGVLVGSWTFRCKCGLDFKEHGDAGLSTDERPAEVPGKVFPALREVERQVFEK